MASFTLVESEEVDFTVIPEDEVVLCEVVKVEVKEGPFWVDKDDHSKGKQEQVSFKFSVVEGPYADTIVFGSTSTTFSTHPNCKLRAWIQEILGLDELPVPFTFDTETLEGSLVNVVITNWQKKMQDGSFEPRHSAGTLRRYEDKYEEPF